nr:integrase, catalytic region, zinc finger, CCHC-type, peptidase aspartic, catalytic [Tanacetum cinerariifolium]
VVQIFLWYLDSDCSKHMIEDRSQLVNFVQKFIGTVKFGNDHVAKIMGYVDYQIGNVTISRASKTKSWLLHRRLSHLNFGAINHLARQGLVREAVATACFTQNRSTIRLRHGKTPYELLHSKLPDLSFFHVFGSLCYPKNDSENLAIAPMAKVIPPGYVDSTGSHSSTTVKQDAPSTSNSPTPIETQSSVIP